MLPIKGIPLAVLAAKRAGNTGRSVIVATSSESSDDGLAALLQSHGVKYFRGSLDNTLDRIVNALAEYDDQTIIYRLTADNAFPDGTLLDEMGEIFINGNIEYLTCNGQSSGLPYGMSVEVMRLSNLREAAEKSTCAYDKEHVTPYIIKKYGAVIFEKYRYLQKAHYRCTIDCLDDYISIQKVFSEVLDPVKESSFDLVRRLEHYSLQSVATAPVPKLVLGTAQLGSHYGINNTTGQPNYLQSQQLIKTAIANGVIYLDTASAYGNSESMIGRSLLDGWSGRAKIITKLSLLQACPQNASSALLSAFVDASVYKSCMALRVQKLDVLMVHRAAHLTASGGGVWQRLLEHKASGLVGALGVSVQTPEELSDILDIKEVEYIQLPFNLFDWRWDAIIPAILATKAQRPLNIHVRSTLLQGLLTSHDTRHWARANENDPTHLQEWLASQVRRCQRTNVADLCLAYVNALKWIDGIVIGMETLEQLMENINLLNMPSLTESEIQILKDAQPRLSEATLDPARWMK